MKRSAKREARIRKLVRSARTLLLLDHTGIEVEFPETFEGTADAEASPEYWGAKLRFHLGKIAEEDELPFVLHEVLHIVCWRLAHCAQVLAGEDKAKLRWVEIEEENLVTHLEHAMVRLLGRRNA